MNIERWYITLGTIFVIVVFCLLLSDYIDCTNKGGAYVRTFFGGYTCLENKELK